jgi:hypothetical protein
MKHAFVIAALLLNYTAAFALPAQVNTNDPNFSGKKPCWQKTAPRGDASQNRLIHSNFMVTPDQPLQKRTRSNGVA